MGPDLNLQHAMTTKMIRITRWPAKWPSGIWDGTHRSWRPAAPDEVSFWKTHWSHRQLRGW